jgi:hypothetical protein
MKFDGGLGCLGPTANRWVRKRRSPVNFNNLGKIIKERTKRSIVRSP